MIVAIPEDPGQAGKSQMSYLTRQLAGFHVVSARETGSKATRAMPLASQVEAGNVSMVRADWSRTLLDEMRDFPWGRKDDQVDALVRAFTTLTTRPRSPSLDIGFDLQPLTYHSKPEFGIHVRYTLRSGSARQRLSRQGPQD